MNSSAAIHHERSSFQLRFQSLFQAGRGFTFPCDAAGRVDMDALGEKTRNSYLFLRTVVGREVSPPQVEVCAADRSR